jgi:hypothetical protein
MNLAHKKSTGKRNGYALVLILCFLVVSLIVFGSMMYWVSSNSGIVTRNNLFNQAQAAAESATEVAITAMQRDFAYQSLNPVNTYSTGLPNQTGWPTQYSFSDTNGVTNQMSVYIGGTNWVVLNSQYVGLYGLGQTCIVTAAASPLNVGYNINAHVRQELWFGSVPLFQFAIFYNLDLEINPGAAMTVNGHVHSNQNIFATGASSGSPLTFNNIVEAALAYSSTPNPNDPQNGSRSGNVNFSITTNNPLSNVDSLILPIGTNNSASAVSAILGLPPSNIAAPNPVAYYESNQIYFYNEADLIVSNAANATNITVYYQNQNNTGSVLTKLAPDVTNVVSSVTNTYYSYLTNVTFYDYREGDNVKALQIDVTKLRTWLTNTSSAGGYTLNANQSSSINPLSKGHGINSIYVYNNVTPSNGVSGNPGVLPAVRVVNGQQLPSAGLTVVTPQPLYVMGNYNTTTNGVNFSTTLGSTTNNTVPAALIGDAITVLSSNWKDNNTAATSIGSRNAAATTINAACLEGIVPTTTDGLHYSGGLENFLRLLESWSGVTLTYNGSIVVMFTSQYATSFWPGTGTVYNPATRSWGYDVNFNTQSKLPPLTPQVRAMIRSNYTAY